MLTDNDIGRLFSVMQAAYGNQWKLQGDAAEVWMRKLGGFTRKEVLIAANAAIDRHKKYPPTLGEFTELVSGPPLRANTYLPGIITTRAGQLINKILIKVLTDVGGVDSHQLQQLVALKNALLDDTDENNPPIEWAHGAYKELTALAHTSDNDVRKQEVQDAQVRFRRRQGMRT